VASASKLRNADESGLSDPYVVCNIVGNPKPIFKTPVVGDTCDPVWNFVYEIPQYLPGDDMELTVYDYDEKDDEESSTPDFLGSARLNSSRIFPDGFNKSLTLTGKNATGSLKVSIENLGSSAEYEAKKAALRDKGASRLKVTLPGASNLVKSTTAPYCVCKISGKSDPEFETEPYDEERVNPDWNHESVIEEYSAGQDLEFVIYERNEAGKKVRLGSVPLAGDRFFPNGIDDEFTLTGKGAKGKLMVKIENLGTVAEYLAQLEAERIAQEEAAERARLEAEEAARREEEERELARIAAQRAKEEAERKRIEELKRKAQEEAERIIREEEARLAREEAERLGRQVISVTVVNDETDEVMSKTSLRLACTVAELGQVVVRDSKLSVMPVLYTEPKPVEEPEETHKYIMKKKEVKVRHPLNSDETLLQAKVQNGAVLRAKISSAVITASKDCTARVWNAETGKCELLLEGHTEAVCSACISPDCRYVATSSEDGSARLWHVDTGKSARLLSEHKEAVYAASFSPDSKQVVTASEDCTAKIWVVKTGLCKLTLKGHSSAVLWAQFSPDGKSVTTTDAGGTLKIWNAKTGICDRTLFGQKPVYLASFASDGQSFVSACGDTTAKICDLVTGEPTQILQGHTGLVLAASFAPSCPQKEEAA